LLSHSPWNASEEAVIEPPIHDPNLLSIELLAAIMFNFILGGTIAESS